MLNTVEKVKRNDGVVLRESDIEDAILNGNGCANSSLTQHVENTLIKKALVITRGNQTAAAKLIGMSRSKLAYKVKLLNGSEC